MAQRFQVDLSGMVDLLSRHLYSGPQVFLRELLQNAVDALAARASCDPEAPARIRIRCGTTEDGRATLEVADTGSGLTADEAADLLATIGRSSKRDSLLGEGRAEFIGQFARRNRKHRCGNVEDQIKQNDSGRRKALFLRFQQ